MRSHKFRHKPGNRSPLLQTQQEQQGPDLHRDRNQYLNEDIDGVKNTRDRGGG